MVQAIRLKKLIIRLNGSIYPFEKIHQPFEWLELSVREIHRPLEQLELSVQERNCKLFWQPFQQYKTRKDFKTIRQALLNDACRHVYITQKVVTLLFFVYILLMTLSSFFTGKRLICKLLSNRKPDGPYVFVAALEDTHFCFAKEINFKIKIAHKITLFVTLYLLLALCFTMRFV